MAKKGPNWMEEETRCFLQLCIDKEILNLLDSKKYKHIEIFKMIEADMSKNGFRKSAEQMKLKLKKLKQEYTKCKENNNISGASSKVCPFFTELDLLFNVRPTFAQDNVDGIQTADALVTTELAQELLTAGDPLEGPSNQTNNNDLESGISNGYASSSSESSPMPKRRRVNAQGRKSYEAMMNEYSDNLLDSQQTMLESILAEQLRQQQTMLNSIMEDQRKWEAEMMEAEHAFQKEQTDRILNAFMQAVDRLRQPSTNQMPSVRLVKIARPTELMKESKNQQQ